MLSSKQNGNIKSFFKPKIKQESLKRPSPDDANVSQRPRSKSPKVSTEHHSPLPIRTDSPTAKRVGPPLAMVRTPLSQAESSGLSLLPTPSESDADDTIVVRTTTTISPSPVGQNSASTQSSSSRRQDKYGQIFITGSSDEDSDDLPDLDTLLGRKPLPSKSVTSISQASSIKKAASKVPKYVDTTAQDEAKFRKLMEQTKKDLAKHDQEQIALAVAMSSASMPVQPPIASDAAKLDVDVATDNVLVSLGRSNPQLQEAMDRVEMQQPIKQWSFFSKTMAKTKYVSEIGTESPADEDIQIFDCTACATQGENFDDGTASIQCDECKVWQHCACLGICPKEAAKDDYTFICGICEQFQPCKEGLTGHFPILPKHSAWNIYEDVVSRQLAFTSGAFEQAAGDHQLPSEIFLWVLEQVFLEPEKDLRAAYQSILHYAEFYINSKQCLKTLAATLQRLGAKAESISSADKIEAESVADASIPKMQISRSHLQIWLQNAGLLAKSMSASQCGMLLNWLLTLTLDSAIPLDAVLLTELRSTITICLESLQEDSAGQEAVNKSLQQIYYKAADVHFRLQCLRGLPSTTRTLSRVKRKLAIASFYDGPIYIDHSSISPTLLQDLKMTVNKDQGFLATKTTDYHRLTSRLACLDIAIADGDRPESMNPATIDEFDTAVDELAEEMGKRYAKIQATGATHISRTEAKDVLEAIEKRLRLAVRINPVKKKDVYEQKTIQESMKKAEKKPI